MVGFTKCSLPIHSSTEDAAQEFSAVWGLDCRKPPNLQPQILFSLHLADPGHLPRRRHAQQVQNATAGNRVSLLLFFFTKHPSFSLTVRQQKCQSTSVDDTWLSVSGRGSGRFSKAACCDEQKLCVEGWATWSRWGFHGEGYLTFHVTKGALGKQRLHWKMSFHPSTLRVSSHHKAHHDFTPFWLSIAKKTPKNILWRALLKIFSKEPVNFQSNDASITLLKCEVWGKMTVNSVKIKRHTSRPTPKQP